MSAARALPRTLVAVSPGDLDRDHAAHFAKLAASVRDAGLEALVLREASLDDRNYFELARELRSCFPWFAVHDRAHFAEALDADAVHVGFRSLAPLELRRWLPARIAIGLSTHATDDPASWSGADYLFHGPLYDTASKRGLAEPIGLEGLERAVLRTSTPIWGIGGIAVERAGGVRGAGARGVAVLGGIWHAEDPARAVREYLAELG